MKRLLLLGLLLMSLGATVLANDCGNYCASDLSIEVETSEPNVIPLEPNTTLMNDRWYSRVLDRTQVYDAPNGAATRIIEPGFNFVTVLREENGWTQINGNEWVQSSAVQSVPSVSSFTGVLLPAEGLPHTMAWVLVNLYPSPAPMAEPLESLGYYARYTRVYILDAVTAEDGTLWYMIGADKWVHQYHVAKFLPLEARPEGVTTDIWVSIDLYEQVIIAYDGLTPIFTSLVATGLPRWPTYEGIFNIYYRNPREFMTWGVVGDDYYSLEEVPWTMFFDEGRALHGAYWHDGFGYRRSHGCVNLSITDAKWMYDWVADYMDSERSADIETGPNVYVYSSGTYDS